MERKRYIRNEALNKPDDFVAFIMQDFFTKQGFSQVQISGEWVWHSGVGMVEIPRFLKYYYQNGLLHLEAWTKMVWFHSGENDMTGIFGSIPKKAYRKDIDDLIKVLYQPLPSDTHNNLQMQPQMNQNSEPMQPQSQPVMVHVSDTSKYATLGLCFSFLGIVMILVNPLTGMGFTAFGIAYSKRGMFSKRKLGIAGMVIGIIGFALCLISPLLGLNT